VRPAHCDTTASSAAAWKSLPVKQIMYSISQRAGWSVVVVGGSATSSPRHTICYYGAGQASKLSTSYLYTGTPPRYSWTDVCMLISPIRISLVVAPARLSYAQFVTRYRSHVWLAIDIAISAYRYNPYCITPRLWYTSLAACVLVLNLKNTADDIQLYLWWCGQTPAYL